MDKIFLCKWADQNIILQLLYTKPDPFYKKIHVDLVPIPTYAINLQHVISVL